MTDGRWAMMMMMVEAIDDGVDGWGAVGDDDGVCAMGMSVGAAVMVVRCDGDCCCGAAARRVSVGACCNGAACGRVRLLQRRQRYDCLFVALCGGGGGGATVPTDRQTVDRFHGTDSQTVTDSTDGTDSCTVQTRW